MADLFTLGYEGTDVQKFIKVLNARKMDTLVDVRDVPVSRKPGFSKNSLDAACEAVGINYEHWPLLGCPKPIREEYRQDGDWAKYTRRYKKHLLTIENTLEDLSSRTLKERICLVCFEADPRFCHRSYIAEAVQELLPGTVELVHLTSTGLTAVPG